MPSDILKVKLSGRVFGDFRLAVDFEVAPGITVLFGPSGAGKSTTLSAIAGLREVEAGRITLGDTVWLGETSLPVHLRKVAYLFQSRALFPHLTALQNVAFGANEEVAKKLLERMQVGHLAHRKPGTYSGGEAQRVALARAFAPKPRLVLLDEPFTALDRPLRDALYAEVKGLIAEAGVPAIVVTHDPEEARTLGSRFVSINAGSTSLDGRANTP